MARVSGYAWVEAMLSSISNKSQCNLARSAAILLIAGMAAGCSSSVARFNGIDDLFTSSTNQRQIMPAAQTALPRRSDRSGPTGCAGAKPGSARSLEWVGRPFDFRAGCWNAAGRHRAGACCLSARSDAAARAEACCDRCRRRGARKRRYRRQIRSPGGPVGRRRCQGMVARWRQPDYSQGRRDGLQSVAPVRGAR